MADEDDNLATPEKRALFLALLSEYGNVSRAAREADLNRTALYRYRSEHSEFAAAWDEAEALGAKALEDEARRRAYEGTLKPVFYQGMECGEVREYSDTLLIVLLKAHFPDKYADRRKEEVVFTDLDQRIEEARKRAGKA